MLKKLFNYCKTMIRSISSRSNINNYSITVSINNDYDLDIQLHYPNPSKENINHITYNAEKYAQLLVYINSPILKNKLITLLSDKSNNANNNINEKLFLDNVIAFHDIILKEIKIIKSKDAPLIRPISVFNIK